MTGIEKLVLCRQALEAIRAARDEVAMLRAIKPDDAEREAVERQLGYAAQVLQIRRKMYPCRMDAAMMVLSRLESVERTVLWRYYVLGETIRAISDGIGLNYRDVQKRKANGLAAVEAMEAMEDAK